MKKIIILLIAFCTNAFADCSPKDLTDPDYLKSVGKEKLIDHFKTPRDQDSVGWCGAYAPSDSLSFAVGEPVSAIDVSINQYANENSKGDSSVKGKRLEKLSGITPLSATNIAKQNGYCPESVIPSDQTSSSNLGHYAILNLMEAFQKIYDDYKSKGQPKDYCVNCSTDNYEKIIKPALPAVTTDMIKDVLIKNQGDSLESFRELLNKLCEGKRVKVDPQVDFIYKSNLGSKKISTVLDEALDGGSMPSIGMNTSFFAKAEVLPGGHGDHELMVVARRMGSNGKCEYLVRNSWGRSCSFYQEPIAAKCDPNKGSFWMDQDQLQTGVSDLLIVKNDKSKSTRKVEKPKEEINQQGSINNSDNSSSGQSSNDTISNPFKDFDLTKFFGKVSETVSKVADTLSNVVSSIWSSLSNFFKY